MRTVLFCFFSLLFPFIAPLSADEEVHDFRGKHLVADYLDCDVEALSDEDALMQVMIAAVKKCGAQVLNQSYFIFPGHGLTMTILLSESHASIHTYPEHGKCFVDLFTCGDKCNNHIFNEALKEYLKPKKIAAMVLVRDDEITELKNDL
jgi:S-adenosylmethionine decarboxylase proenzyme